MDADQPSAWAMEKARSLLRMEVLGVGEGLGLKPLNNDELRVALALDAARRAGAEDERKRWAGVRLLASKWDEAVCYSNGFEAGRTSAARTVVNAMRALGLDPHITKQDGTGGFS